MLQVISKFFANYKENRRIAKEKHLEIKKAKEEKKRIANEQYEKDKLEALAYRDKGFLKDIKEILGEDTQFGPWVRFLAYKGRYAKIESVVIHLAKPQNFIIINYNCHEYAGKYDGSIGSKIMDLNVETFNKNEIGSVETDKIYKVAKKLQEASKFIYYPET